MKVYLAAAFKRKQEIKEIALRLLGVKVTSRWLHEKPCPTDPHLKARFMRDTALMDLADIREADVIVRFTDGEVINVYNHEVDRTLATGARHFECGYAQAQGKPIIVVGGAQNVFDYLPGVTHLATVNDLVEYLSFTEVV